MIQIVTKNLSLICLILLSGVIISNNVNSHEANQKFTNPTTISFLYCYSCGYRKAFEEYQSILSEKYPDLIITGANYEPSGVNFYLSRFLAVAKYLLMALIGSSVDIFGFFGIAQPMFWTWAIENKLFACMMTFFFGNMLEAQLIASGAFEISLNDIPIWSKIQTGRIPSPQELFGIIDSQLQFSDNFIEKNPDFVK